MSSAVINKLLLSPLQVMTLLRAAGGEQEGASWEQSELVETLWAEMGLQPDAHITHVCQAEPAISNYYCRAHATSLAPFVASSARGLLLAMSGRQARKGCTLYMHYRHSCFISI